MGYWLYPAIAGGLVLTALGARWLLQLALTVERACRHLEQAHRWRE